MSGSRITYRRLLAAVPFLALLGAASAPTALAATCVPGTFYVTERWNRGVAKVTVDASCTATVQNNFVNTPPQGPDSVVFDTAGRMLISNTDVQTISEVDPTTGTVIKAQVNNTLIPVVADLALDPSGTTLYTISWSGSQLWSVNLATGDTSAVPTIANDGGIVMTPDGRLFLSSHNGQIAQIDPSTGNVIRSLNVPGSPDGLTYDPITGDIFAAGCGAGICEVIIGPTGAPVLDYKKSFAIQGDGIAADGQGNILVVNGGGLYVLHVADGTTALEATGIFSPDDVAPLVGAGAPPTSATPELDSLVLFGSGVLGFGGYAMTRMRVMRGKRP